METNNKTLARRLGQAKIHSGKILLIRQPIYLRLSRWQRRQREKGTRDSFQFCQGTGTEINQGNVGIGTTAPSGKLEINVTGDVLVGGSMQNYLPVKVTDENGKIGAGEMLG
ncbi:MAG: hypothetical protein QMD85_03240 [Candidatus Aenigmarchaeota archaeon]|nr:hypothetical protein [Candidatus Aenigmarchaeota archaeon]MDI6722556.1 hypothetical protein [Candidatus Aenigmarchaeota archaeon]